MSTSLDRKIEAAKLRAEAERKQAGRPATPDEVVAFESGRAVTADQTNMRMRSLLDKMPVAKPPGNRSFAVDLDLARFAALWNDGADAPIMETPEYLALMAARAGRIFPGISSRDAGKMTQCEKTLREIVCPPHDAPLFRPLMGDARAEALRESARKAANEAGGSGISIKESTPKAVEQLILEIAMLRAEVGRLQQECHALRFGQNVQLRGGE